MEIDDLVISNRNRALISCAKYYSKYQLIKFTQDSVYKLNLYYDYKIL